MPTEYDLETGYALRGAEIVECDGRRQLAVDTHDAEHKLEAKAVELRQERNRPWWKLWPR